MYGTNAGVLKRLRGEGPAECVQVPTTSKVCALYDLHGLPSSQVRASRLGPRTRTAPKRAEGHVILPSDPPSDLEAAGASERNGCWDGRHDQWLDCRNRGATESSTNVRNSQQSWRTACAALVARRQIRGCSFTGACQRYRRHEWAWKRRGSPFPSTSCFAKHFVPKLHAAHEWAKLAK